MQVIEVSTPKHVEEFLQLPKFIYKNDPNWIQPLQKDVTEVFDSKKNKAFRHGTLTRFIVQNNGKTVGRIAAFVSKKYKNKNDDCAVGGIGFFECIDDQATANLLFDTAKNWLKQQQVQAMDGPINFGERDRWWGLVTKGFYEPLYCMNYNPAYYVTLFENYGFKVFYNQVCLSMHPKAPLEQKIWERHNVIAADKDFRTAHLQKNDLAKYANDFATVYNKAWAGHGGLKQLSKEQVMLLFTSMKPVMNEKIIWYAYYKNEPVAIFVNIPDLNQWFKHLHGKFGVLQKLQFLWYKQFSKNKKFTGLVFGVVPEWQGKGVDAYIIASSTQYFHSNESPYLEYEMQWIGDFNPKMLNVAYGLGNVKPSRNLSTYRYLFDREKAFERHPIL